MILPNTYVLDVTFDPPVFCPHDTATGETIVGLMIVQSTCPGDLIGIIHADGQYELEKWIAENRDWYEKYKKPGQPNE